jgi:hypothetical protein
MGGLARSGPAVKTPDVTHVTLFRRGVPMSRSTRGSAGGFLGECQVVIDCRAETKGAALRLPPVWMGQLLVQRAWRESACAAAHGAHGDQAETQQCQGAWFRHPGRLAGLQRG